MINDPLRIQLFLERRARSNIKCFLSFRCPLGEVMDDNDACVPVSECQCVDEFGQVYPPGYSKEYECEIW